MTPRELADEIEAFIRECRERAEGVGAQQYYREGEPQRFESMPIDALFEYAEEELRDIVNYAAMTRIRLRRMREGLIRPLKPAMDNLHSLILTYAGALITAMDMTLSAGEREAAELRSHQLRTEIEAVLSILSERHTID